MDSDSDAMPVERVWAYPLLQWNLNEDTTSSKRTNEAQPGHDAPGVVAGGLAPTGELGRVPFQVAWALANGYMNR